MCMKADAFPSKLIIPWKRFWASSWKRREMLNGKWFSFEEDYNYEYESKLSQSASLSDQVVQISMPNSTHIMER